MQTNCRHQCSVDDVHGPEERARLVALVEAVVADLPYLELPATDASAPLVFERSGGRHGWYYSLVGHDEGPSCLHDCRVLNGFPAPDAYCDAGVGAGAHDVLLILTAPHTIDGIAAAGGACAFAADGSGRATAIVVTWYQPLSELLDEPLEDLVARHRMLVIHEVFHGCAATPPAPCGRDRVLTPTPPCRAGSAGSTARFATPT